jgi:hypothetical protein
MGVDPDSLDYDAGYPRIGYIRCQPKRGCSMIAAPDVIATVERNCRLEPLA